MTLYYLSPKKLHIQNHLAMLPCGDLLGNKIMNWTTAQLKPYLFYLSQGKILDTMFGGLIFNPISTRENRYIYPLYAGFGELADKVDWELFIDHLFKKKVNFHAAAMAKRSTDIWVVLPYPLTFQHNFGRLNGESLDFEIPKDRFLALKWWIDEFLKKWKSVSSLYSNLKFRGFTWQRDAILEQDLSLVKSVNKYIHLHHLLSMWLPNFGSSGVVDWMDMGFDITCINSNYYGNTNHDFQWINHTASFAKYYHTGIQINYGKGLIFKDSHLLDYLNLGLPQHNQYMNNCLLLYQFHNQKLTEVLEKDKNSYARLYSFIKGKYSKIPYKGIPY